MEYAKCAVCGRLIVADGPEELALSQQRHGEVHEAALASLRNLFPRLVDGDGVCSECEAKLRTIVREPVNWY